MVPWLPIVPEVPMDPLVPMVHGVPRVPMVPGVPRVPMVPGFLWFLGLLDYYPDYPGSYDSSSFFVYLKT